MIWVESERFVEPVSPKRDILETVEKTKKTYSEFQLYLDNELGRLARDDKRRQETLGR